MNENNGWLGKPGVLLNPEQDGWHWVYHDEGGLECAFWIARSRCWQLVGAEEFFEPFEMAVRRWLYLNPVLTPDEATALQARVAELEDIIRAVHRNAKNLAGDRTFDQCITALMRIDDLCRAALGEKDE